MIELIWRQQLPTRRQAEAAIFQYINRFYVTRTLAAFAAELDSNGLLQPALMRDKAAGL